MVKQRIVVTGASGFLGKKIQSVLTKEGEAIGAYNSRPTPSGVKLDITNQRSTHEVLRSIAPTVCIHCAATPDIDPCEKDPARADKINAEGAFNIMSACWKLGTRLIHISTDYVFSGNDPAGYSEESKPNPLQSYGKSKLAAEKIVAVYPDALILRVPFLFGWNDSSDKMTWPRQCVINLRDGKPFKAESTQIRQPTLIDDIAVAIKKLISMPVNGILHFAVQDAASKYDWACLIAELMGKDSSLITPFAAGSDETPRPLKAWLKIDKLSSLGLESPRGVREGTAAVINNFL